MRSILIAITIIVVVIAAFLIYYYIVQPGENEEKPLYEFSLIGRKTNTSGWTLAKGSTRTYSMWVSTTEVKVKRGTPVEILFYAWIFDPKGSQPKTFTFTLFNGEEKREFNFSIEYNKPYYEGVFRLRITGLKKGAHSFSITWNNFNLSVNVKVIVEP